MLNKSMLCILVLGALEANAVGQTIINDAHVQARTAWVSKGGALAGNRYLARYNFDKIRGQAPMMGVRTRNYDFVAATADTMNVVVHDETAPNSYLPKNAPTFKSGPHPVNNGWNQISFPAPIAHARGDVWIGNEMVNPSGTNSDGGYTYILRGEGFNNASTNYWDMPGQGISQGTIVPKDALYASGSATSLTPSAVCRTLYVEKLIDGDMYVAGNTATKTNQTDQPGINNTGVVTGWNSGGHPDINGLNTLPALRADDTGFRVEGPLIQNKPVIMVVSAGWFLFPVIGIEVNLALGVVVPMTATTGGVAQILIPNAALVAVNLPAGFRAHWQAAFAGKGGAFTTSPAATTTF